MSHISAIQGLRGVAVGGVLLYHVASYKWPLGLLGVDMFFLISGYLMCSIMSKPLASVEQFYFRRIRRIVPSYLFLLGLMLITAAAGFVSPMDYWHLLHETKRALTFTANIPNPHENNYFSLGLGLYFFLRHLWSISTELHFYALVPFLCNGLSRVRIPFRIFICLCFAVISFCSQTLDDADSAHMALHNRLWQFMAGFIAFYVQQLLKNDNEQRIEPTDCKTSLLNNSTLDKWLPQQINTTSLLCIVLQNLIQIILLFLLLLDVKTMLPIFRVLAILLSALIVIFPPSSSTILNLSPLVWLGNISYSVYLIHWPAIHLYFYDQAAQPTMFVGSIILSLSITAGYLTEKLFVNVTKWTTTWLRLITVVALCYLFISIPYTYVHQNEAGIHKTNARSIVTPEDRDKLLHDIDRIWNGEQTGFNGRELAIFNYQLSAVIYSMTECSNRNHSHIPTKYDIAKEITFGAEEPIDAVHGITVSCVEKGNGTKNIVIVGNSHAQMLHFGVKKFFAGVYANLTVVSAAACPLIEWDGRLGAQSDFHRQTCFWFRDKIHEVLRQWDHPIDILIIGHAYPYPYDQPEIVTNRVSPDKLNEDKYFLRFQRVFLAFAELARDFVFIPHNPFFNYVPSPADVLTRKILQNATLSAFRRMRKELETRAPLDDRLKYVNCSKCIHMNWEDVWCSREFNSCDTVDYERRIGHFTDGNHVNAMGSLRYGQYIRRLYDERLHQTK